MARIAALVLVAGFMLTGCGEGGTPQDGRVMQESGGAPPPAPMMAADQGLMNRGGFVSDRVTGLDDTSTHMAEQTTVMLAYTYHTSVELPADQVAATQSGHVQACTEAGPATCQIVRAQVHNADGPRPSASLQLRASPDWLTGFRASLSAETEAAGGSVISDQTSVEDLTARIADTQARLLARTTLRDRLQDLLENREGDLGDLLQVERELANVQAELDSQASVLAVLQQRVNTSLLTVNYQAERQIVEPETFNPITQAFKEMGNVFANSLARLILVLAGLLPWLVIAVPVISAVVIGFRRMLRRKKPA